MDQDSSAASVLVDKIVTEHKVVTTQTDEERLRAIVREELEPVIKQAVEAAVAASVKKFTHDFYADVGKGVIQKMFLPVLGAIMVYWAHRLGLIPIFDQK